MFGFPWKVSHCEESVEDQSYEKALSTYSVSLSFYTTYCLIIKIDMATIKEPSWIVCSKDMQIMMELSKLQ